MYYLYNSRLKQIKQNKTIQDKTEIVQHTFNQKLTTTDEANKNKNFQLIASTKNNLKIPEQQIAQGIYSQQ